MRKINKKIRNKDTKKDFRGANQSPDRKRSKRTERKNQGSAFDRDPWSGNGGRNREDSYGGDSRQDDYIYGVNPVREALRGEREINSILIASGGHNRQVHEIIELAREKKVPIKEVPISKLNMVCDTKHHQNVVAYVSPVEYYSLEKALLDDKNSDFIVALDGITDVHNLGAVMRTIEASGFKYIMIPERRSAQVNSTVAKTSAGALEFVRTIRVSSLSNAVKELKEQGYWVVGADVEGNADYTEVDYKGKILLIIGSEDKGISPGILKQCDHKVKIPMRGRINSLNASVSASILIYQALKSREQSEE